MSLTNGATIRNLAPVGPWPFLRPRYPPPREPRPAIPRAHSREEGATDPTVMEFRLRLPRLGLTAEG